MTNRALRKRFLASTIIAGAALALPAHAQTSTQPGNPVSDPAEAGASTGPIQGQTPAATDSGSNGAAEQGDIIVTGSRIPQPNLTSSAPVTVVTQQEIKLQGTTRIEDLLNSLPQVLGDQGSTISNGSTGTATVNLRGLGAARTLVLINGRRLLPGDPFDSSADLNAIPSALIKRVDVLTGGASSTYGADAVAGVVNFIMDTDFEGIRADGQYSFFQHNNNEKLLRGPSNANTAAGLVGYNYPNGSVADGGTVDASLTMGTGFDDGRGHIVAYVGYRKSRPILQSRRDYSSCTVSARGDGSVGCGGSATSAEGNYLDSDPTNTTFYHFTPTGAVEQGTTIYNFAPTNYYQRQDERYTAGFFGKYEINDAIKPYMEFMFMDDRSTGQAAPSGDFGSTTSVNCDNPFLSAAQRAQICRTENQINGFLGTFPLTGITNPGPAPIVFRDPLTGAAYNRGYIQILKRNTEGGPRIEDFGHTEYRAVLGSKGTLNNAFSYDAYYQYGRTLYKDNYFNDVSISRLTNALDAVSVNGVPTCRTTTTPGGDATCVPYNVFTVGGITPAAAQYVSTPGQRNAVNTEQVVNASITGKLGEYGVKTPWADDGLTFNAGVEYRKETLNYQPDIEFATGDLAGQGAPSPAIKGSFDVFEEFIEAQLPIVHDSFIYNATINGGYRHSKYKLSTGGGYKTDTYKIGGEISPIRDITLRGSYNRAVRAPNLVELFQPNFVALDGSIDPCAGSVDANGLVNGKTAAQCANTGVTAAQFGNVVANPAGQYNGLVGGNTALRPEVATTKTFGVVLQPSFLPRLAVTVDYYDIKVEKAIQGFGADTIVQTCVNDGDPTLCALIHRNPVGSLWLTPDGYTSDLSTNIGSVRAKGIDVTASYVQPLGEWGSLGANLNGSYLDKFVTDNGLSEPYNCAGYYGTLCGVPAPKWRHKARLTYTAPNGIGVSVQWRYFSKVKVDKSSTNSSLGGAVTANGVNFEDFDKVLKSQSYFDLALTSKIGDHYSMRAGVQNIFDKIPPLVSGSGAFNNCLGTLCNGNTYPAVYDALGRYIYIGATLDF